MRVTFFSKGAGAWGMKKKIQKTLILAFEVIVQPLLHTLLTALFHIFSLYYATTTFEIKSLFCFRNSSFCYYGVSTSFHQKKKDMKNLKTWECSLRKSSVYICIFLPPKWPSFGGWFWNVAHLYLVLTIYRLNFLSSITKSPSFDDIDNKTKEIPAV